MGEKEDQIEQAKEAEIKESSLSELLNWDGNIEATEKVELKAVGKSRPAISIVIRAISQRELQECNEAATMKGTNPKTGMVQRDFDFFLYRKYLIYKAVVTPDLDDTALQSKFNKGNMPIIILDKILLPGELDLLADKITELSGFPSMNDIEFEKKSDVDLS